MTDSELVGRGRRGSRAAAEALFERHWQRAWRVALAITQNRAYADDAAQLWRLRSCWQLSSAAGPVSRALPRCALRSRRRLRRPQTSAAPW